MRWLKYGWDNAKAFVFEFSIMYLGSLLEPEETIDEAKVKDALEKIKDINIDKLILAFVQTLRVYGDLATRMGQIQKDNPEAFDSMQYLSLIAPQLMKKLAKEAPPQEFGAFIKAFFDLLELGPKLDQINDLPADEKIEIGKKLFQIASVLEEMVKKGAEKETCEASK